MCMYKMLMGPRSQMCPIWPIFLLLLLEIMPQNSATGALETSVTFLKEAKGKCIVGPSTNQPTKDTHMLKVLVSGHQ